MDKLLLARDAVLKAFKEHTAMSILSAVIAVAMVATMLWGCSRQTAGSPEPVVIKLQPGDKVPPIPGPCEIRPTIRKG